MVKLGIRKADLLEGQQRKDLGCPHASEATAVMAKALLYLVGNKHRFQVVTLQGLVLMTGGHIRLDAGEWMTITLLSLF